MQIFVRFNRTITVTIETTEMLVSQFQLLLFESTNIDWVLPDYRIIWSGKQLETNKTLADYGVRAEVMFHLCGRLRGAMYHSSSGIKQIESPTTETINNEVLNQDLKSTQVTIETHFGRQFHLTSFQPLNVAKLETYFIDKYQLPQEEIAFYSDKNYQNKLNNNNILQNNQTVYLLFNFKKHNPSMGACGFVIDF